MIDSKNIYLNVKNMEWHQQLVNWRIKKLEIQSPCNKYTGMLMLIYCHLSLSWQTLKETSFMENVYKTTYYYDIHKNVIHLDHKNLLVAVHILVVDIKSRV